MLNLKNLRYLTTQQFLLVYVIGVNISLASFLFTVTTHTLILPNQKQEVLGITTTEFHPTKDAHVKEDYPDKSYGNTRDLISDGDPRVVTFITFDLTDLAEHELKRSTLKLHTTRQAPERSITKDIKVANNSDWGENNINWANMPSVTTIVGRYEGDVTSNQELEIALDTTQMQNYLGQEITLAVTDDYSGDQLVIYSRQSNVNVPTLVIETEESTPPDPDPAPGPDGNVLFPTDDAHVKAQYENKNYGKEAILEVDEESNSNTTRTTYIQFDTSAYTGKNIQKALLKLTVEDGSDDTQNVKVFTGSNWDEDTITYETRPLVDNIPVAATISDTKPGDTLTLDLSTFIPNIADNSITVAIENTDSNRLILFSKENEQTNKHPQLILETGDGVPNVAPVAIANALPTQGTAPLAVNFDALGSYDPDGSIVAYEWDFGDGTTSDIATLTHIYPNSGNYTVTLTVTDNSQQINTDSLSINVSATLPPPPPPGPGPTNFEGIWISPQELSLLPIAGEPGCEEGTDCYIAWNNIVVAASNNLQNPDISNQDDDTDVYTYAAALVYARTNNVIYRQRVADAITAAMGTEDGGKTLALGRNLLGYILAADLINLGQYNFPLDTQFRYWLDNVRYEELEGRTLISTHEDRPNNWGTHAGASRIAAALYLEDEADLAAAVNVFKGFLGDSSAYNSFIWSYGTEWNCPESDPVPLNPAGCMRYGYDLGDMLPDDQRRQSPSGAFEYPFTHENYVWEAIQGVATQAELLYRQGFDTWEWGNNGVYRAVNWLHEASNFDNGNIPGEPYEAEGDDRWIPWLINKRYGSNFPAVVPEGVSVGKGMGFTEWTHQVN